MVAQFPGCMKYGLQPLSKPTKLVQQKSRQISSQRNSTYTSHKLNDGTRSPEQVDIISEPVPLQDFHYSENFALEIEIDIMIWYFVTTSDPRLLEIVRT
ncbi:hypothetical protein BCON_0265g00010 [Botryotinia convoluta]|uniref:Uncharacterized protein n=1 Tax=Botryotinia convoluta TaxID=54673 RepID=A0A4Z1HF09_9HELO|nr:hypothetical protein BCON_0265g00010 [Botryotinia convoluta]